MRPAPLTAGALLVSAAVVLAGCTGTPAPTSTVPPPASASGSPGTAAGASGAVTSGASHQPTPTVPGASGTAIPARTTAAPAPSTPATAAPTVVQFDAPTTFRCLADGKQAQVTMGWNVPTATAVDVQLDGSRPAVGIQDALPYQVPAGRPVGVGSTVVFDCAAATQHTLTVRWTAGADPFVTERSVTVRKEGS